MKEEEINKTTIVHNVSQFNLFKHSKIVWILKKIIKIKHLKTAIPFLDISQI